jgi:hypothetical protein
MCALALLHPTQEGRMDQLPISGLQNSGPSGQRTFALDSKMSERYQIQKREGDLVLLGIEPTNCAIMGLGGFDLPISGRSGGHERTEEMGGGLCDFVNRPMESRFVRSGRFGKSADLPHELQSRRTDLLLRRRRFEIVKDPDVSAHVTFLLNRRSDQRLGKGAW